MWRAGAASSKVHRSLRVSLGRARNQSTSSIPRRSGLSTSVLIGATALVTFGAAQVWQSSSSSDSHSLLSATGIRGIGKSAEKDGPVVYASKEDTDKVIDLLKGKLRDDQVSTDKEDCLGHGMSPNTYHGKSLTTKGRADEKPPLYLQ